MSKHGSCEGAVQDVSEPAGVVVVAVAEDNGVHVGQVDAQRCRVS